MKRNLNAIIIGLNSYFKSLGTCVRFKKDGNEIAIIVEDKFLYENYVGFRNEFYEELEKQLKVMGLNEAMYNDVYDRFGCYDGEELQWE